MTKKVTYIYPQLFNCNNLAEWMHAYNNYAAKASQNNNAINSNNALERKNRDDKMSCLDVGYIINGNNCSVNALAKKIQSVFHISSTNNAQILYEFMVKEFIIWKYGFSKYIYQQSKHLFSKAFKNNYSDLENIFTNVFCMVNQSKLLSGNAKFEAIKYLTNAFRRKGIGVSGASALLSLIFSHYIGTCDTVLIKQYNICKSTNYTPNRLNIYIAQIQDYIKIKSEKLNVLSGVDFWTPRKIDQAIWANRQ